MLLVLVMFGGTAAIPPEPDGELVPIEAAAWDFGDGLQGWTVEELPQVRERGGSGRGVHDTIWSWSRTGHDGVGGLAITAQGGEVEAYGDLAHVAVVSPVITGASGMVALDLSMAFAIEGDPFDHLEVEWRGAEDESWMAIEPLGRTNENYPAFDRYTLRFIPDSPFRVRVRLDSDEAGFEVMSNTGSGAVRIDDVGLRGLGSPGPRTTRHPGNGEPAGYATVIALIGDRGINPYHEEFRDRSPQARRHPATYIPGFPEGAEALELSLDAPTIEMAIAADRRVWESTRPDVLYWVPGTKIVGVHASELGDVFGLSFGAEQECDPYCGLAPEGFNGTTWSASRAAGSTIGACPDCRLAIFGQKGARSLYAAADNLSWIDVVAHNADGNDTESVPGFYEDWDVVLARIAERRLTFAPAVPLNHGLGWMPLAPSHQALNAPNFAPGVITVGGHDNGHVVTSNPIGTHLIADSCRATVAQGYHRTRIDNTSEVGAYLTSPRAAGHAGRLLHMARRLLGDKGRFARDADTLATSGGRDRGPADGPLADGRLTLTELRHLVLSTATARPSGDDLDGDRCVVTEEEVGSFAWGGGSIGLAWRQVDDDVPAFVQIGYGAVDDTALSLAMQVLHGRAEAPHRPLEDAWFDLDDRARRVRYAALIHQHVQRELRELG